MQKVENGLSIVVHWAEGAFQAVIQFAEQVWDVIQYVLEKIGVFFENLVRWTSVKSSLSSQQVPSMPPKV